MKALVSAMILVCVIAAPALARAARPFDGRWSVHAKADPGVCEDKYGMLIDVAAGQVRFRGLIALIASGTVSPKGAIVMQVGEARVEGQLGTRTGGGRWASPKCRGGWTASRV
ncbi:MAG TPA: hypothetical protein VFB16_13635 [Bauldia sp.]|nr:hypothetical protein [Bauldia sp.]